MSIADKLTYLNTTKQLLKAEINKINNVLTDESTFRSYPQELFNGYLDILNNGTDTLWNNLTKVSQADVEEAELSNVVTALMKISLKGNTSQKSTTGKNVFNYTRTTETVTINGVTSTLNDDGSITLNGTATAVTWFVLNSGFDWQTGDYTMYLSDETISGLTLYSDVANTQTIKSFSISEAITKNIALRINSGTTLDNVTVYPMILKGTYTLDTIGEYEKYTFGASPNPNYPQEVKVVKGENVVSVSGKNLFDVTKHTNTLDANTTIISANEFTLNVATTWRGRAVVPITNFKKNTDYTFSYISNNPRSIISKISGVKDGVSTTLVQNYYYVYTNKATINTSDYDEIIIDLYATGNGSTLAETTMSNLQFEEGTSITNFVPYSKTDYTINLGDIELCQLLYPIHQLYKTDAILVRKPKWYLQKRVGKVVLNENYGNWSLQSINTYGIANFTMSPNLSNYETRQLSLCISDYFTRQVSLIANTQSEGIYISQAGKLYIRIDSTKASNVSEFLTWLSSHNVTLYYALATPTEEEITNTTLISQLEAISKAKSVKDKTFITQTNDDLPFILDVEAIKEYSVE